ncbi:unnamed protein product, partial [Meganyctiphanes norvegica]
GEYRVMLSDIERLERAGLLARSFKVQDCNVGTCICGARVNKLAKSGGPWIPRRRDSSTMSEWEIYLMKYAGKKHCTLEDYCILHARKSCIDGAKFVFGNFYVECKCELDYLCYCKRNNN